MPSGELFISEDTEAGSLQMWPVIGDRITPDGQAGHTLSVQLERYEGKLSARPQDSSELGEGGRGVRPVLDCVNRHDAVSTGGVQAGPFEGSLPERRRVIHAYFSRTLRRARDGDRGQVDSDQSRLRLPRDPQPGPAGSAAQVYKRRAGRQIEPAAQ